jgi:hypothetical protein
LIEKALAGSDLPWTYSDSDSAISVLKPHGSINWNDYLSRGMKTGYSGWRPICPDSELSYDSLNPLLNPDRDDINPNLRYMVFPGDPENELDAEKIWRCASKAISERDSLVIIGYSLPEYDDVALDFLKRHSAGKKIEVYNPSKEHLEKFRRFFGSSALLEASRFEDSKYAKSLY